MKFVITAHDSKFIDVLEMDSLFEFEQVYQTLYLMIYQQFLVYQAFGSYSSENWMLFV